MISNLCGQGCLDLNAYIPVIGHSLLESIKLLISANKSLTEFLIKNLSISKNTDLIDQTYFNPSVTTALSPYIGYHHAAELAQEMKTKACSIFEANKSLKLINNSLLNKIMKAESLIKQGYSLKDLSQS